MNLVRTTPCGLFILEAVKRLGAPYKWGAKGHDTRRKAGTDCSGLPYRCARLAGVRIPRGSWHQYRELRAVPLVAGLRTLGALLFMLRANGTTKHVAISLGDGEHTIEALGAKVRKVTIMGGAAKRFQAAAKIDGLYR